MTRTATPVGRTMQNDITLETSVVKTAEEDVRVGPTTLLHVQVDNTETSATKSYLKIFDANVVVPGTDKPDLIIPIPAIGTDPAVGLMEMLTNLAFTVGLSYFASQENGNEATLSPAQALVARIITTAA